MSLAAITNNIVTDQVASPSDAAAHFTRLLTVEADCSDVHSLLPREQLGFVLLDVRAPQLYAEGHVPRALNLPHRKITAEAMSAYPPEAVFVVYCSGPHCNGADKAALRLALLGRPVKKMIGGISGWCEEGFELAR